MGIAVSPFPTSQCGLLAMAIGPACLQEKNLAYPLPCGITMSQFDAFHELIVLDEVARCGSGGVLWGLMEGLVIGLPPVLLFGSEALQQKVVKPCLSGEKVICLAITEPSGGSDVANLKTTAVLSADKSHYIVNGTKKWITNGVFADFFTTAVRTGDPKSGAAGCVSVIIHQCRFVCPGL